MKGGYDPDTHIHLTDKFIIFYAGLYDLQQHETATHRSQPLVCLGHHKFMGARSRSMGPIESFG